MDQFALVHRLLGMQEELLSPEIDVEGAMAKICAAASSLAGAAGAALEWHDPVTDEMVYRHATGTLFPFVGMRLPRAGSLSGLALETSRALVCDDSELDERVDRAACRRVSARSMVVVPLAADQVLVGVLKVAAPTVGAFTATTVELLQLLGGFLATAIMRAAASQRRAALERQREQMAALIVHDLRSPLTAVMANVEYIQRELPEAFHEAHAAAADALISARRLGLLIGTLLDTARLEDGSLRMEPQDIRVRDVVRPVFAERARDAAISRVQLACSVDDETTLRGDAQLLRRVVENIVDNAIRYTPEGGRVEAEAVCSTQCVELRIGNTGQAIPPSERSRIFDKYAQLDVSVRANVGLGMHFCRLATEAHAGEIRVESNDRFPTVFVVSLPIAGPCVRRFHANHGSASA